MAVQRHQVTINSDGIWQDTGITIPAGKQVQIIPLRERVEFPETGLTNEGAQQMIITGEVAPPLNSPEPTTLGEDYIIRVSGTMTNEYQDVLDANYHLLIDSSSPVWYGNFGVGTSPAFGNNATLLYDDYSPARVYLYEIVGTGAPLPIYFVEEDTSRAQGRVVVDIYPRCSRATPLTRPINNVVARIGTNGSEYLIGVGSTEVVATSGNVFLKVDSCFGGEVDLLLVVEPAPPPENQASCAFANVQETEGPNPIRLRTGDKVQHETDLSIQSPLGQITFTRHYVQSKQTILAYQQLGLGWTHNHHYELTLFGTSPNRHAEILLPEGQTLRLAEDSANAGHFDALSGSTVTLDYQADYFGSGDHAYLLELTNKQIYAFDDATGLLRRIIWPNDEELTYSYSSGQLTEVADDYGRKLLFSYYASSDFKDGKLWRVGDQTAGGLDTVAPSGRYVEYVYSKEQADGIDKGKPRPLLASVTDARGEAHTYVYYGQTVGDTDFHKLNWLVKRESPSVDTTGDQTLNGALTLEELDYSIGRPDFGISPNFIQNKNMESTSSWSAATGATPNSQARSSLQAHAGTYSWRVDADADEGIQSNTFDLQKDKVYTATAWVYLDQGPGTVKMAVDGVAGFETFSTDTLDTWQQLSVKFLMQEAATGLTLQFTAADGAALFFVDDVEVYETNIVLVNQKRGNSLLETDYDLTTGNGIATLVTQAGRQNRHLFLNDVHLGQTNAAGDAAYQIPNDAYRPFAQADANGNETGLQWSTSGKLLEKVTDADGNETDFSYNSDETLKDTVDAEGRKTEYTYGDSNNPRQPTVVKVLDTDGTTVLQHQTFAYDSKGRTTSEKELDPSDGTTVLRETTRGYYAGTVSIEPGAGLLQTVTQKDIGGSDDVTTTYFYDEAGRVVQTNINRTFGSCNKQRTLYDDAGNVLAAICNYEPGASPHPTTVTEAVALYDAMSPDENHVTTYEYDALGRRVKTTTDAGAADEQVTLTVYDALDRVVRTIRNYVADAGVPHPYTAAHSAFDHGTDLTHNLVTETAYNERGLVEYEVDVEGNITLFGYDEADRLVKTIRNLSQPVGLYDNSYATGDPDLSAYVANSVADEDIVSQMRYDAAGNLVWQKGPDGMVTFTVYDALNRPVKVVRAAKDTATIDLNLGDTGYDATNDPRSVSYAASADPARDLMSLTEYDALGRTIKTQDAAGVWTLYGYDGLGRQVKVIHSASQSSYDMVVDPDLSAYVESSNADEDIVSTTVYDAQGRTLYSQDVNGNSTWVGYDGLDRQVKTVVNAQGTATDGGSNDPRSSGYTESSETDEDIISQTVYDADGRVKYTTDMLGRSTLYGYDELGRRVKVIRNATNTAYDTVSDPDLSGYTPSSNDDEDVVTETVYDDEGRVFKQMDRYGNEMRFEYDELGRRVKTTRNYADGVYSAVNADEDLITETVYDLAGRVSQTTDPAGIVTQYEYDKAGRRVKTIQNYVDGVYSGASPDEDIITLTTYDKAGRVVETTDARGTKTQFGYDVAGRRITVTRAATSSLESTDTTVFDKGGRTLRRIMNYIGDGVNEPWEQDAEGDWLFVPNGHGTANDQNLITEYELDKLGRVVKMTDPLGNVSETVYFKDGRVQSMTDPLGYVTQYRYDGLRRRFLTVQAHAVNGDDPVNWHWDDTDGRWEDGMMLPVGHGTENDRNVIVETEYDKAGRVIGRRDPKGQLTTYAYDKLDRRTNLTMLPGDTLELEWATAYSTVSNKPRQVMTDPMSQQTQRDFDKAGRLVNLSYLSESPKLTPDVAFAYDARGNQISMTEEDGSSTVRETLYGYDDLNRLTQVDFDTDGDTVVEETVSYEYDAGGLRTTLTMPGGLEVVYVYDDKGRLTSLTDWDNQQTEIIHDTVNRLRSMARGNQRSTYQYDPAGRLQSIAHRKGDGYDTNALFEYQYDARGNRIQATETLAHPSPTSDPFVVPHTDERIDYRNGTWTTVGDFAQSDSRYAEVSVMLLGDEPEFTLGEGPDHGIVDVSINGALWNSVDCYASTVGERVVGFELNAEGPYEISIRGRGAKNRASSGYRFRLKEFVKNVRYDLHTVQYQYDAVSRLSAADYYPGANLSATPFRTYDYAYDLASNRTQKVVDVAGSVTTTNYSYNALNQLTSDATNTLTYDTNGNLTNNGVDSYTWDRANRVLSHGGSAYTYDGAGRRLRQDVGGTVTEYLLDVQPGLYKVIKATTGANTDRYLHGRTGIHAHEDNAGTWQYMLPDALGSVRAEVNASGTIQAMRNFAPYGDMFGEQGTFDVPFGFTGEPHDQNGLTHLRARYYDPSVGRFFKMDPSVRESNLYAYAGNNPLRFIDPSGLEFGDSNCGLYGQSDQTWVNNNVLQGLSGRDEYVNAVKRDREYFLQVAERRLQELKNLVSRHMPAFQAAALNRACNLEVLLGSTASLIPSPLQQIQQMTTNEFAARMATVPILVNAEGWWQDYTSKSSLQDFVDFAKAPAKHPNPDVFTQDVMGVYLATGIWASPPGRNSIGFFELRRNEFRRLFSGDTYNLGQDAISYRGVSSIKVRNFSTQKSEPCIFGGCFEEYLLADLGSSFELDFGNGPVLDQNGNPITSVDHQSSSLAEVAGARLIDMYLSYFEKWSYQTQGEISQWDAIDIWWHADPMAWAIGCSKGGERCTNQSAPRNSSNGWGIEGIDQRVAHYDASIGYFRDIFGSSDTDCLIRLYNIP